MNVEAETCARANLSAVGGAVAARLSSRILALAISTTEVTPRLVVATPIFDHSFAVVAFQPSCAATHASDLGAAIT
jgi:hypothetical protein